MEPLVSVIVPVYNVEKYLNKCVDSIVNQTYKNLEIILVDDGSPDNCPQMCDDWAEKDSRIKVIHKENGGVSSARNTGLDKANGEYISFIDSDDYIDKDMFKTLLDKDYSSYDLVEYGFTSDKKSVNTDSFENDIILNNTEECILNLIKGIINPSVCDKLYNSKHISSIRFNKSKSIGEDYLFNFAYLLNIEKIIIINKPLYFYSERKNSATNVLREDMINRWKNTKEIISSYSFKESSVKYAAYSHYIYELLCCINEAVAICDDSSAQLFSEIQKELALYRKQIKNYKLSAPSLIKYYSSVYFPKIYFKLYKSFKIK